MESKVDQVAVKVQAKVGGVLLVVLEDNKDGSYVATIVPNQVGEIKLSASIRGKHIQGSPFTYPAVNIVNKVINDDGSLGQPWALHLVRMACGQ